MLTDSCSHTANETVGEINSNQHAKGFSLFDLSPKSSLGSSCFTQLMGPFTIDRMSEVAGLRADHRLWTFPTNALVGAFPKHPFGQDVADDGQR